GFYLHTDQMGSAPELQVSLKATVSDSSQMAHLQAALGFLKFTATDMPVVQPGGGLGSYVSGLLKLDLVVPGTGTHHAGRLTPAEMESAAHIEDVLVPRVALNADVQFHLVANVGSNPHFPHMEADFDFGWQYDTNSPATNGVHRLGFNNVRMNLTDFVNN